MNLELNRLIRMRVRGDLVRASTLVTGGGLESPLSEESASRAPKIAGVTKTKGGGKGGAGGGEIFQSPPTTQIFIQAAALATANAVSPSLNGPTYLEHIEVMTYRAEVGGNQPMNLGLHISKTKNVGAFTGDIEVFNFWDPLDLLGTGQGAMIQIYKQREDTLVGWRNFETRNFFPRRFIPFGTFWINASMRSLGGFADCYVTLSFGVATG